MGCVLLLSATMDTLYRGDLTRDQDGLLEGATLVETIPLVIEDGTRPDPKRYRDMEGLALASDGVFHISAEHNSRTLSYADAKGTPDSTAASFRQNKHAQERRVRSLRDFARRTFHRHARRICQHSNTISNLPKSD